MKEIFQIKYLQFIGFLIVILLTVVEVTTIRNMQEDIDAGTITSQVTISNSAPSFTVPPFENPASIVTTPINVGSILTFDATATDTNNENYYLTICRTDTVTHNGTSSPTCPGGQICVSSSTVQGNQATCNYTVQASDLEDTEWYGFVCDSIAEGSCSASSQGVGDSGSPFYVNHRPTFVSIDTTSDIPGGTIVFTTVASDSDILDTPDEVKLVDQVKLVVCSNVGATITGCTNPANEICNSPLSNNNPTCTFNIQSIYQDGNYTYHAYIFDTHGLGATNNPFPSKSYQVINVSPVVSNVVINSGLDIALNEGSTKQVDVTATVSDSNSCLDISTVEGSIYRSSVSFANCNGAGNANDNFCYIDTDCVVTDGSCVGSSDGSANYLCSVNLRYFSDSTVSNTQFPLDNWVATVEATDNNLISDSLESSSGVELLTLIALSISNNINFGGRVAGTDTGSDNETIVVTPTGNVGLDLLLKGTDFVSGLDSFSFENQKYSTSPFTFNSGGTPLTANDVELELNIPKITSLLTIPTSTLYWGLNIPNNLPSGTYLSTITLSALTSELTDW